MAQFSTGDAVLVNAPGMDGVWRVTRTWAGRSNTNGGERKMVEVSQGGHVESVGEDDVRHLGSRTPDELTAPELVAFVEGLREVMYGDCDEVGNPTWNPDMSVVGSELIAWVGEEMARLGLVPARGERPAIQPKE